MRYAAKATLAIVCLFLALTSFAQDNRRDGNYWRTISSAAKPWYIVGFFDGMDLGNSFSYWKCAKPERCAGATDSYNAMNEAYLANVKSAQLIDALDQFYNNPLNRSILIGKAVWIVLNGIAGMPKDKLETMTENWRKSATRW